MPGSTGLGVSPYVPTSFDAGTNQNRGGGGVGWSASSYDAYGNVIQDSAGNTFAYDVENRQTSAGGTTYMYDGNGQRVQRTSSSGTSTYIYDVFGSLAAEYDTQATPMTGTIYLTPDQLGSTRLVTSDTTTLVNLASPGSPGMALECRDYLPFGEQLTVGRSQTCAAADAGVRQLYTGQERDTETNLDFLNARYLSSPQGRFTSPDPDNAGADPAYPQTWNMYSYALNNPLAYIDPTGLCSVKEGDTDATDDPGEPCVAPGDTSTTVTDTAPPVNYAWSESDLTFFSFRLRRFRAAVEEVEEVSSTELAWHRRCDQSRCPGAKVLPGKTRRWLRHSGAGNRSSGHQLNSEI